MKPENKVLINSIFAFVLMSSTLAYGQSRVQSDIYGRAITDSNGERINYSKTDYRPSSQNLKSATLQLKSGYSQQSNCVKDTFDAKVDNLYSVMGTSIGRNSMHSLDIDNDGVVELICTASSKGYGSANYWYLMHYSSTDSSCNQIWTSSQYSANITTLEVVDFSNDNQYKILLCFDNGTIHIYDGKTRNLLKEVQPVNEKIKSLVYADADNDSKKDIVISCESNTYVLDADTYSQKFKIAQGANYVRVGNINSDSDNEIVLSSGTAYHLINNVLSTIWRFSTSSEGYVELSDIDSDSKEEIVFAELWYSIKVYDADTKTTKYTISADLDINTLYLKDVNNDGVEEIIYGDGQWGEVYCHNSVTQALMWSVNNPEHGVAAINCADLNCDGTQELIWSAGWTSTGEDYLYIYNVSGDKLLWRSSDIVGPFYAITKGDVDGDGKDEIVAVSYESDSGYGSGVLLIIDSETNKLKWKSDGDFLYLVWTGIYDVSIKNIDDDDQNEIIIAAGQTYNGKIWIIDGKNHTVKSSHLFESDNISEFYALAIDDTDNDGKDELLAASHEKLYAIDPTDWAIKWSVTISPSNIKPIIRCADLNNDGKKETVVCKGSIHIVDGSDHSVWKSQETNYLNFDTFDDNNDGVLDIIATTKTGHIVTIDGKTKTILKDVNPETTEISSVRIRKLGSSIIYIYSCNGRINFYKNDSSCSVTQFLGNKIGEIESLKFFDEMSDTSAILIGTPISLLKVSGSLIKCLELNINVNESEVSCDKDDGKILLNISGGTIPYEFLWNDNSTLDSLTNLSTGDYWVKVQDNGGCVKIRNINLIKAAISADLLVIDEGCTSKGSAHINISHINAPYSISWSNLETGADIYNLTAGNYTVLITDSKNCKYENVAHVKKDTVIVDSYIEDVSCYGLSDGSIYLSKISGVAPLTYNWDVGGVSGSLKNKTAGKYNVSVTDALGCESNLTFEITQPNELSYSILVSPDDLSTPNWDGKIMIENISGGSSPYRIYWSRFSKFSDYLEVLPVGEYAFILIDANNCYVSDTAIIESLETDIQNMDIEKSFLVYPNPAISEIFINKTNSEILKYSYDLINSHGQIVKSKKHVLVTEEKIDLTDLESGFYLLRFYANNSLYYTKIIIE